MVCSHGVRDKLDLRDFVRRSIVSAADEAGPVEEHAEKCRQDAAPARQNKGLTGEKPDIPHGAGAQPDDDGGEHDREPVVAARCKTVAGEGLYRRKADLETPSTRQDFGRRRDLDDRKQWQEGNPHHHQRQQGRHQCEAFHWQSLLKVALKLRVSLVRPSFGFFSW